MYKHCVYVFVRAEPHTQQERRRQESRGAHVPLDGHLCFFFLTIAWNRPQEELESFLGCHRKTRSQAGKISPWCFPSMTSSFIPYAGRLPHAVRKMHRARSFGWAPPPLVLPHTAVPLQCLAYVCEHTVVKKNCLFVFTVTISHYLKFKTLPHSISSCLRRCLSI